MAVGSLRSLGLGVALTASLTAAPACFIFKRGEPAPVPAAEATSGEVALHVTNHNYLDVVIYVFHDGVWTRVGTVTGSSSTIIFLPIRLLGQGHEIRLLGHAIGSTTLASTETLVIQPGQYIDWTLETDLRRSSVAVY